MKILAIGNSFSQDATRYLYGIAKADKRDLKVVNLYIGGCSLATHYKNMNNDARAYAFELNGMPSGIFVSIREALQSDEWDYVTLQQVSQLSPHFDTYVPYINALSDYVRLHAPKARQLIHQTWAYEDNSERLFKVAGFESHDKMFLALKEAYEKAAREIGAVGIIPSGEAMRNLIKNGADKAYRDTFHASFGLGRYTLALTWYEYLTGCSAENNGFCDFDEPVSESEIALAKMSASAAVGTYPPPAR